MESLGEMAALYQATISKASLTHYLPMEFPDTLSYLYTFIRSWLISA